MASNTYKDIPADSIGDSTNPSVGTPGDNAPAYATEIAGVSPTNKLVPVAVTEAGLLRVDAAFSGNVDANTVEQGTVDYSYGDVTNVASGVLTTLVSYTAGGPTRLKFAEVSGTNIATYTVLKNGSPINKKQSFYGYLDNDFQFSKGLPLVLSDVITVKVIHQQASVGEFSGFLLLLKDY